MIDWHARFYDALPFSKDVKFKRSLQLELLLEPKKSLKARVTTNRERHTHTRTQQPNNPRTRRRANKGECTHRTIMLSINPSGRMTAIVVSIVLGYCLGSTTSLEDVEQFVNTAAVPLYQFLVTVYITIRVYYVWIEPFFVSSSKATAAGVVNNKSTPIKHHLLPTGAGADQPINMSGVFKLTENQNFEEALAAQGVPWAVRGAANRARPTHRITHVGNSLTIKIEGIIESQTTYQIDGPSVVGLVRGRRFEDSLTYLTMTDGNDNDGGGATLPTKIIGVQTKKRALDDGYTVLVHRILSEDSQRITMNTTIVFDDESKEEVKCKQIFQRNE